ncbi:L-aspartate oxidase [Prolixibacteraceae bacterium JC049]|nr:L-aspartate oxidase [Prolixibacteraceae bacterium JC049]
MKNYAYDFVIIGSGLAGLVAAHHASKHGKVAIITKSAANISNSWHAQGGIAAAIAEDDRPEDHFNDTLTAGRGLCNHDAVNVLVNEGVDRIKEIIDWGMEFDRENGEIILGLEGGHQKRRIFHAGGDATGQRVTNFMLELCLKNEQITFFENTTVLKLIVEQGRCGGLHALNYASNEVCFFGTKAVIMATGGHSRIYCRTTNPHTATGDGIYLAWEAGAELRDMEFVQFHPTALSLPDRDAFLISEAVRGEGAWLLNEDGERFMAGIHPMAELAPRDVVAFAIHREIMNSSKGQVYISVKHLDAEKINNRFRTIQKELKSLNFDLTTDEIPIAPAAHYMVGGIKTDLNGCTNIDGLYACGEVASTGVMGANRLASNSLLECLVFGRRAAEHAQSMQQYSVFEPCDANMRFDSENEQEVVFYKNKIAQLMSQYVGIVRNEQHLQAAINELTVIAGRFKNKLQDYNCSKIYKMSIIGLLIAEGALKRTESRGGHIREDYRDESEHQQFHSIQQKSEMINYQPVVIYE